MFRVVVLLNV